MSPKLKKGIRWVISAAILVFLILFARTIDWHAAWNSMRHASLPLLAAAIGVNILSVLIKGVRWWLFLRPIGINSLPLAIRATIAGAGLNNLLVANGGDAARVVFVSRVSGVPSSTVLASMAERRPELHGAGIDGAREAVRSDRFRHSARLWRPRFPASPTIRGVENSSGDRARGNCAPAHLLRLCDQEHQAGARSRAQGKAADLVRQV